MYVSLLHDESNMACRLCALLQSTMRALVVNLSVVRALVVNTTDTYGVSVVRALVVNLLKPEQRNASGVSGGAAEIMCTRGTTGETKHQRVHHKCLHYSTLYSTLPRVE